MNRIRVIKVVVATIAITFCVILLASCGIDASAGFQIKQLTTGTESIIFSNNEDKELTQSVSEMEGYSDLDSAVIAYNYRNSQYLIADSVAKMRTIYDSLILRGETSATIYLDLSKEDKLVYGNKISESIARSIFDYVIGNGTVQIPHYVTNSISVTSGYDAVYSIKNIEYWERAVVSSDKSKVKEQINSVNFSGYVSTRGVGYNNFEADKFVNSFPCRNSEQLWYALQMGFRPDCAEGSMAEILYTKAKNVLIEICDDSMSDVDKIKAIYEWLVFDISYDNDLCNKVDKDASDGVYTTQENLTNKRYNGFFLEGVFNDGYAVCDGISKAFVVLANLEGIPCVRETGQRSSSGTVGHAWNKIYVDGVWYAIDATSGNMLSENAEIADYSNFLISDNLVGVESTGDYYKGNSFTYIIANSNYEYFKTETFIYQGEEYDFNITTPIELEFALKYLASFKTGTEKVSMQVSFDSSFIPNFCPTNVNRIVPPCIRTAEIGFTPTQFICGNTIIFVA